MRVAVSATAVLCLALCLSATTSSGGPLTVQGVLDGNGNPTHLTVLGPFANGTAGTLANVQFDPADNLRGVAGERLGGQRWSVRSYTDQNGTSNGWEFNSIFSPNDEVHAFAYIEIYEPTGGDRQFSLGADDTLYVYVDGTEVYRNEVVGGRVPDEDQFTVTLSKGWHRVLVANGEAYVDWGIYFRIPGLAGQPYRLPVTQSSNQLVNPGFEDGTAGWFLASGMTHTSGTSASWGMTPRSGVGMVEAVACSSDLGAIGASAGQYVDVVPGVDYTFGVWYITNTDVPRVNELEVIHETRVRLYINWYTDAEWPGGSPTQSYSEHSSTELKNNQRCWGAVSGTAPADCHHAEVYAVIYRSDTTGCGGGAIDDAVFCPSRSLVEAHAPADPQLVVGDDVHATQLAWQRRGQPSTDYASSGAWINDNTDYVTFGVPFDGETCLRITSDDGWSKGVKSPELVGPGHYKVDYYAGGTSNLPHPLSLHAWVEGVPIRFGINYSAADAFNHFYAEFSYGYDIYTPGGPRTYTHGRTLIDPVVRDSWYTVEVKFFIDDNGEGAGWCCVYPRDATPDHQYAWGCSGFPADLTYRLYSWNDATTGTDSGAMYLANFRGVDYGVSKALSEDGDYQPYNGVWDRFDDGDTAGWSAQGGTWSVADSDDVLQSATADSWHALNYAGFSAENVFLECDVYGAGTGRLGLRLRGTDAAPTDGFIVYSDETWNHWRIAELGDDGDSVDLGCAGRDSGEWHRLRVLARYDTLDLWVDGLYQGRLQTDYEPGAGFVGLLSRGGEHRFDNVELVPLYDDITLTDSGLDVGWYYYSTWAVDALGQRSNAAHNLDFRDGAMRLFGDSDSYQPVHDWFARLYHAGESRFQTATRGSSALDGNALWAYSPGDGAGTDWDVRSHVWLCGDYAYRLHGWMKTDGLTNTDGTTPNLGRLALFAPNNGWSWAPTVTLPLTEPAVTGTSNDWQWTRAVLPPQADRPLAQDDIRFRDFSDVSDLTFNYQTSQVGDVIYLGDGTNSIYGECWYNEKVFVRDGFDVRFRFRLKDMTGTGADGFAFNVQNIGFNPTGEYSLWEHGVANESSMGAISLSFDTHNNGAIDAGAGNDNHMSLFDSNHNDYPTAEVDLDPLGIDLNVNPTKVFTVRMFYDGERMTVLMDGTPIFERTPLALGSAMDSNGYAWIGFSSRSGSVGAQVCEIFDWSFTPINTVLICGANYGKATGQVWYDGLRLDRVGAGRAMDRPNLDSLQLNPGPHYADSSDVLCATVTVSDEEGWDDIEDIRLRVNDSGHLGGLLRYSASVLAATYDSAACGDGYAGLDTTQWGAEYVNLVHGLCSTSTTEFTRTVTFCWKIHNTWGDWQDNDISAYAVDANGLENEEGGWYAYDLNFDVLPAAPSLFAGTAVAADAIAWTWTSNSGATETGFRVKPSDVSTVADATGLTESGLSPNTEYTRAAVAFNTGGESAFSNSIAVYTLAATPAAPTLANPSQTSLDASINANGNPAGTEFALRVDGGLFVQSDGTLAAGEHWATAASWGGVTITGLAVDTQYSVDVKARNADGVETGFGPVAQLETLFVREWMGY